MFSNPFSRSDGNPDTIDFEAFEKAVSEGEVAVVDVREPHEFAAGHIVDALNLPLSRFDPEQLPSGKPVVLICQSGRRSLAALNQARHRPRRRQALCRRHDRVAGQDGRRRPLVGLRLM